MIRDKKGRSPDGPVPNERTIVVATGRKLKSKKSASKRFFVSGTGKVRYHKTNKRHLMTGKSSKRTRSLKTGTLLKGQADIIRAVLG